MGIDFVCACEGEYVLGVGPTRSRAARGFYAGVQYGKRTWPQDCKQVCSISRVMRPRAHMGGE